MQNMIMEVVTTLAVAIVTGAITVLVAFLQSMIKSDRINASLARLETVTNATVHELQQTFVEGLKEKAKDGKLSDEQIKQLQAIALGRVKVLLDDPAAELIRSVGMDLDALIKALVEKAVAGMKMHEIVLE